MLQVLGRSNSINVRKVLWLCSELGLPITHAETGRDPAELRTPAFLRLNPNGKVPVIVEGSFVLWESNTILRFLAGRAGRDDLLPVAAEPRAIVEQWMDWASTDLNAAWRYAFMALSRRDPRFADAAQVEHSAAEWNRHMRMLEDWLQDGPAHVAGDGFTLADIVLGLATNRWRLTPIDRPELPAVDAWMARLAMRSGFRLHAGNGLP